MNKLKWKVTRSKKINRPVILKSGPVCSSNVEKVINLMARFCSMKRGFYISRVGITSYQKTVDKERIQKCKI